MYTCMTIFANTREQADLILDLFTLAVIDVAVVREIDVDEVGKNYTYRIIRDSQIWKIQLNIIDNELSKYLFKCFMLLLFELITQGKAHVSIHLPFLNGANTNTN